MCKICVVMGGVMPVPAVCGGAIETLVTSIVKKYSSKQPITKQTTIIIIRITHFEFA